MRSRVLFLLSLVLHGLPSLAFAQSAVSNTLDYEFCGYDWAQPSPEFVAEYNRVERQRIALGYTRVCDRVLPYSDLQKEIKPWIELLPLLGFIPVDLGTTPFAQYELIGGVLNAKIPAFAFLPRSDHVTRVFRRKDGPLILLEEWDLTIIGGGVSEVYRGPDVLVKGWPGYWDIIQAKSGTAYSGLWWQGATRKFELTVNTNLNGVMHSFTGSLETAQACWEMGLHISFAGMVTFKNNHALRAVAAAVPADRILIETDCPYLAPSPNRGKRNEPAFVKLTAECLAGVRGMSADEFAALTTANAKQLFRLP